MSALLRNQLIRVAFGVRSHSLRLRRALRLLGRPRIGALDHITIPVRDLATARTFYCDVLGAAYSMTVDDETFRRFGRPTAPNGGEGSHHVSVYFGRRHAHRSISATLRPTGGHERSSALRIPSCTSASAEVEVASGVARRAHRWPSAARPAGSGIVILQRSLR